MLVNVLDQAQLEPEKVDLAASARHLMDDHHGKCDREDHRHES